MGEIHDGEISIILRFLTYRQRHVVFSEKKELKCHVDKTFISENLTRHRYDLLKSLNTLCVEATFFLDTRWFCACSRN